VRDESHLLPELVAEKPSWIFPGQTAAADQSNETIFQSMFCDAEGIVAVKPFSSEAHARDTSDRHPTALLISPSSNSLQMPQHRAIVSRSTRVVERPPNPDLTRL
jgi:hypothetical protein